MIKARFSATIPLTTVAILTFLIVSVTAGGPLIWRFDGFAEVGKGELRGVTIDSQGGATLAPPVSEVFDTKQAYIWSSVVDGAGNIFFGTGSDGRIYRLTPGGQGTMLCQLPGLNVMALAVDGRGELFAASSPDGKVYRITAEGEPRVFFEPGAKYIWALAFDPQGRLLVATGEKGLLYRVTPEGTATVLATVSQSNLTTLRFDRAGNIIVGTDPGGMVLRISPEGKVFTLFDSDQREIRDLAVLSGPDGEESIFALALAESAGAGAAGSAASNAPSGSGLSGSATGLESSVTVTLSDVQVIDAGAGTTPPPATAGSGQARTVLYRLNSDGAWQVIWESREAIGFSLLPPAPTRSGSATEDRDRRLLLALGQKISGGERGRILAIDPEGQVDPVNLVTLPEGQVARLARANGRIYAASSNLGRIFAIASGLVPEGTVTSGVLDSVHHATWGELAWRGAGSIELQTRSGNTSNPDQTWSDWLSSRQGRIGSPAARYLQWRAILRRDAAGSSPRLRDLTIHYLPRNLPPRIGSLTVLPVGLALQPPPPTLMEGVPAALQNEATVVSSSVTMPPRRVFQQGALTLQWQADDRNGDHLEYSILYRLSAGTELFSLRTGLRDTYFTIDSKDLPDESYVFRVIASDRQSNPPRQTLTGQRETETIIIDNTAPELSLRPAEISGRAVSIRANVVDRTSTIRRAEYQIDGGAWITVFPLDGLADSRQEEFLLTLDLPDQRPHLVALRVFDANANIAIAQTPVTAK